MSEITELRSEIINHVRSLPNTEDYQFIQNLIAMGERLNELENQDNDDTTPKTHNDLRFDVIGEEPHKIYPRFYGLQSLSHAFEIANSLTSERDNNIVIIEYPSVNDWNALLYTLAVNSGNSVNDCNLV